MTYPAYKDSAVRSEEYTETGSLPDRLSGTGKPLLVIFGEQDQIYDAREALSAYAAIPGSDTLLIPDSGHSPQIETPEKTAGAINAFADGISVRADRKAALKQKAERARNQARQKFRKAARRKSASVARQKSRKAARRKANRAKQVANSKVEPAN